ncbi:hypothetical protein VTL71DRAFT_163 [Oculimacula yallundae]|jgi:hypothetical protein
MPLP